LTRGKTVLATITRENPVQVGSKYLTLPLDKVASAVSTQSLFTGGDQERLIFPKWGKQQIFQIPFDVIDPRGHSVKNAIVLYGPLDQRTREMPARVRLKCESAAKAIHLLSGVAGWGYHRRGLQSANDEKTVCMILRLHYRDGGQEDHELINGVHFCDYWIDKDKQFPDVPGSRLAIRLLPVIDDHDNQMRYLAIHPKSPNKVIEEIEFIKGMNGDVTAPVIMAVTVEKPNDAVAGRPPAGKPPDGVIAWWRADGNAKDSVGDHHGTLKNGVTFAQGVAEQAFRLDGATRYVEVPRSNLWGFGRRDFSIELWVQFRGAAASNDIHAPRAVFIGCDEGNAARGNKWFFAYGGGFLNFHIHHANVGGDFYAKAAFEPDLEQWYHLAVTRSGGTFTVYVNGAPVASQKVDVIIPNPDAPLTIGQAENLGFFSGLIDEVAIYDRALSPAEVKARWSALAPAIKPVGEVRRFEGHTNGALSVAFCPDGRHAFSGAGDGTVRLWEVATGREVRRFSGHTWSVNDFAFSPDGSQVLTASRDRTVRLWDVQTGREIRLLKGHTDDIYRAAISPDGRRALSGCCDGTMRLWDLKSGEELRRFPVGTVGVAFSPDGRRALSGDRHDTLVRLWDVETGAEVRQLRGHTGMVTGVAFLPGGRQALSSSHDQTLRLWDLDSGQEIRRFSGHTGFVIRVAINRDGRSAISASADKTVRVWDLQTGKELHCFTGHTGEVWAVACSPDGGYALSGSHDGTMRLWRLPDPPPAKKNPRRAEGSLMETSVSMLERLAGAPTADDWRRLDVLYRPLLKGWVARVGVPASDIDDLVQDVLVVVVREVAEFERRRKGAFRAWLRGILTHRVRDYFRGQKYRPTATGDSDFQRRLDELESPESALSKLWDREHDRHVAESLMRRVQGDFDAVTLQAFRRHALEGEPAAHVALGLGLTPNAVLLAKSHVLKRLRQEVAGLVE
jgi:RNA polymerase sigma factor (sigma-70 family)